MVARRLRLLRHRLCEARGRWNSAEKLAPPIRDSATAESTHSRRGGTVPALKKSEMPWRAGLLLGPWRMVAFGDGVKGHVGLGYHADTSGGPAGSAGSGHGSDPDEEALLRRIREFLRHGAAAEAGVEEWGEFAAQLRVPA